MEGNLLAEEKPVTGNFVVSFSAESNQKAWMINALEQNIYNDLSGYGRIIPFNKTIDEDQTCSDRDIDCIIAIYKKLNVDALMLATVSDSYIDYETYDVQSNYLVKTGSIKIGSGSSLLKLRMGAFNAFKPFIEKGGILDRRKHNTISEGESHETNRQLDQNYPNSELKNNVLIFLAVLTCFPYFLTFIGKPRRHPERLKIVLRWFYPFQLAGLLAIAYLFLLDSAKSGSILYVSSSMFDSYDWFFSGLGGMLWACFFIINYKVVVPHLQGIERINPDNLLPLLHACLLTIIIKTLIIATLYIGLFNAVLYTGELFSINEEVIVLLIFPISGLYLVYWIALLLDVFSMSLDVRLSAGKLDFTNVWNLKVREYFIGYLKRNGITLKKRLVDDIVFLPGENKGVVCYGGGFSRPRMTIENDLIKFALGDINEFNPEDTGVYARKVFEPVLRQSSIFQLIPNFSSQSTDKLFFKSRQERHRQKHAKNMQQYFVRILNSQDRKHTILAKNVLQGQIYPCLEENSDSPALMSENLDDMQVLEKLFHEYSWGNDRYDDDAEVDDSNEQDKDFLFGALLLNFGELLRHDDIFSTIRLYFRYTKAAKMRSYNFLFSKYFAIIADTFVVLNFGLNHLMQHLYYQATNDSSHLTTKGINSRMLKSQDVILTSAMKASGKRKMRLIQTDELERVIWLSRFCQDSIKKPQDRNNRAKKLVKWSITIGVTYFTSLVLINSYNYHPKYIELIEKQKQVIAEAIKNKHEQERKEK